VTHEQEQQSLITVYKKQDQVNIEVFLYQDEQNLSITSNVSVTDLFGKDPLEISF
jgi:hypothetical protein